MLKQVCGKRMPRAKANCGQPEGHAGHHQVVSRAVLGARRRAANPELAAVTEARHRAKRGGLPRDSSEALLACLGSAPSHCPKCQRPMRWNFGKGIGRNSDSPSLDKLEPCLGYVCGNVRWICNDCNKRKSDCPEYCLDRKLGDTDLGAALLRASDDYYWYQAWAPLAVSAENWQEDRVGYREAINPGRDGALQPGYLAAAA